jgi:CDP-diacylglycerol---serine O-phosphatidyltransferase
MSLVTQSIPSILTLGNLFMGLLSMVNSMEGSETGLVHAAWFIIAAAIFDGLDGKASRLLNAESKFGVELDSIVDVCSFGIAPALLAYQFTAIHLPHWQSIAFPAAFIFAACGALRLARFNVQLTGFSKSSFSGVPIPMAAGTIAAFVIFTRTDLMATISIEPLLPFAQLLVAGLMVSTVKYDTMPRLAWDTALNRCKIVVLLMFFLVAAFFPAEAFFPMAVLYLGFGLVRAAVYMIRSEEVEDESSIDSADSEEALA